MKRLRNLDLCISSLVQIQGSYAPKSEQRSHLQRAIRKLKRLKRSNKLNREEVFTVVSEIVDTVLEILSSTE